MANKITVLKSFKGIKTNKTEMFEDMHLRINNLGNADPPDKVMFAGTYLKRPAFNWFEPYMQFPSK
ncbi:hypothetical protein BDV12DRAFT_205365 [Aspergillus spectabilis]